MQQSPAPDQPQSNLSPEQKKLMIERRNMKLFQSFYAVFRDASPKNHDKYQSDAAKLAQFLSDPRGYYTNARREILKLLVVAQGALRKELGWPQDIATNPQFPPDAYANHPLRDAYAKMVLAIRPHIDLFVESDLRDIAAKLLLSVNVDVPHVPPSPSSPTMHRSPVNQAQALSRSSSSGQPGPNPVALSISQPFTPGSRAVPASVASRIATTTASALQPSTQQSTPSAATQIANAPKPEAQRPSLREAFSNPAPCTSTVGGPVHPASTSTASHQPGTSAIPGSASVNSTSTAAGQMTSRQSGPSIIPSSASAPSVSAPPATVARVASKKKRKPDFQSLAQRDIQSFISKQRQAASPTTPITPISATVPKFTQDQAKVESTSISSGPSQQNVTGAPAVTLTQEPKEHEERMDIDQPVAHEPSPSHHPSPAQRTTLRVNKVPPGKETKLPSEPTASVIASLPATTLPTIESTSPPIPAQTAPHEAQTPTGDHPQVISSSRGGVEEEEPMAIDGRNDTNAASSSSKTAVPAIETREVQGQALPPAPSSIDAAPNETTRIDHHPRVENTDAEMEIVHEEEHFLLGENGFRVLALYHRSTARKSTSVTLTLSAEQVTLIKRWTSRAAGGSIEGLKRALCLSIGCYDPSQIVPNQPLESQLASIPSSSWPEDGDLQLRYPGATPQLTDALPLAPPLSLTPDNTFDISELAVAGGNTFEFFHSNDCSWSSPASVSPRYLLVLFLHHPTPKQIQKVEDKRRKDDEWHAWIKEMSKPVVIKLPRFGNGVTVGS